MTLAIEATTLDSDSRLRFGVASVNAGIDGGSSKQSWLPDAIICAHDCSCGIVYFDSCLNFHSATVSLVSSSICLCFVVV